MCSVHIPDNNLLLIFINAWAFFHVAVDNKQFWFRKFGEVILLWLFFFFQKCFSLKNNNPGCVFNKVCV